MAYNAFATILKIGDSTGGATAGWGSDPSSGFTTIAEVKDLSGPSMGADDQEVTYHQAAGKSTTMFDKQYIQGLRDGGEISIPVNLLPADSTHDASTGLLADFLNGIDDRDFVMVFGDAASTAWYFCGYIKGFEPSIKLSGKMSLS